MLCLQNKNLSFLKISNLQSYSMAPNPSHPTYLAAPATHIAPPRLCCCLMERICLAALARRVNCQPLHGACEWATFLRNELWPLVWDFVFGAKQKTCPLLRLPPRRKDVRNRTF